jgi:signal transduction histidine kinase
MTFENETLTLVMADNGMGIAPEIKDKIFHEIITTKPAGQGTGLGMYLTWDIIVNKHKGKILLDSQEGKGSTFTFIIPAKSVK